MLPRSHSFLAVAIVIAAALSAGPATGAGDNIDWDNKRDAARAHSSAIQLAWGRMSSWIQRRPRGTDLDLTRVRGPHVWRSGTASPGLPSVITAGVPGSVPPVWNPAWTERGLSFAFCDQMLAVFATEELRGADMPTVAVEGGLQIVRDDPVLGPVAKGTPQSGYSTVEIPDCMTLPEGHVALVATSIDPFGWAATRRRNEHDDWERACPMPGGDPAATVGKVRYAQTRPIELHPWSGADMDRWPDLCRDRPAAGGTFTYSGPVYGAVTTPPPTLPDHGECSPPGPQSVGDHISEAIRNDGCRKPTRIGGTRQPRWHFYDTLCADAAPGGDPTAIDGGASTHAVPVSEGDGSVFLGPPSSGPGRHADYQYKGTPLPNPIRPPIPACETRAYCPGPYTSGGAVGDRTLIEKRRALWKQSQPGLAAVGTWTWGTGNRYRRDYVEPGGASGTGVVGVARGDQWIKEDFIGCYQEVRTPASCASHEVASGELVEWNYHEHDPLSSGNPHEQSDTRECTAVGGCTGTWVDTDGDGQTDGLQCSGGPFIPTDMIDPGGEGGEGGGVGSPGSAGGVSSGGGEVGGMGGYHGTSDAVSGVSPGDSGHGDSGGGGSDGSSGSESGNGGSPP